jgi:Flp pilus assembly protein CpaB
VNPLRALFLGLSRMPPALTLLLIVGLAGVVAVMVAGKIETAKNDYDAKIALIDAKASAKGKVVYSLKDVPEGQSITSDALEEREIAQDKIPTDASTSSSLAAGRIAKYGIASGQLISQHDLAPQGIQIGFEAKLREGMRAVTFGVDTNSGVAGFVNPDSRVDIVAMVGTGAETKARPILSDVEVIAVGQTYQKAPGQTTAVPASSVTVAVTPEDCLKLIKGISASKLYLALRNDKDHTPVATVDITSMFQKPVAVLPSKDIALAPPSFKLPPPPTADTAPMTAPPQQSSGSFELPKPPQLHEIEIWSGSKKDVLSVPKG